MPVAGACNPNYLEGWDGRISVQSQPGQTVLKTPFQNNQSKIDWRYGSSSRVPALQVWSPEFTLQSHQKKKGIQFFPLNRLILQDYIQALYFKISPLKRFVTIFSIVI
jgi:hypothetical protein